MGMSHFLGFLPSIHVKTGLAWYGMTDWAAISLYSLPLSGAVNNAYHFSLDEMGGHFDAYAIQTLYVCESTEVTHTMGPWRVENG